MSLPLDQEALHRVSLGMRHSFISVIIEYPKATDNPKKKESAGGP